MTAAPESYFTLPTDFAAELGQAIAAFGWLEEVIKRTLYALERKRLARDLSDAELKRWLHQMDALADDSMGTLIEQLDAALRRHPGIPDRIALNERLLAIKRLRNLLCHASWRPTGRHDLWHPAFVNTKGEPYPDDIALADLSAIRTETRALGQRILAIMHATGVAGVWVGDDPT